MKSGVVFLAVCFVQGALCYAYPRRQSNFNIIDATAIIDPSVQLGRHMNIGPYVRVQRNTRLGSFCNLESYSSVGEDCRVGEHSNVGEKSDIGKNTHIATHVDIGKNNTIGDNCKIDSHCETGESVKVYDNVQMKGHSKVEDNVEIAPNVVVDEHADVGMNSKIGEGSYCGKHCDVGYNAMIGPKVVVQNHAGVGPNSKIGEGAYCGKHSQVGAYTTIGPKVVVLDHANIPNDKQVPEGSVVMQTPTSLYLYEHCAPSDTLQDVANVTSVPEDNQQFSSLMDDLIDKEIEQIEQQLLEPNVKQVNLALLPAILTVYLTKFHGPERFEIYEKYVRSLHMGLGRNVVIIINGNQRYLQGQGSDAADMYEELRNERHFTPDQPTKILNPEQEKKVIKLMAIDQDSKRQDRVQGDTLPEMIHQILTDKRKVLTDCICQP